MQFAKCSTTNIATAYLQKGEILKQTRDKYTDTHHKVKTQKILLLSRTLQGRLAHLFIESFNIMANNKQWVTRTCTDLGYFFRHLNSLLPTKWHLLHQSLRLRQLVSQCIGQFPITNAAQHVKYAWLVSGRTACFCAQIWRVHTWFPVSSQRLRQLASQLFYFFA